MKNQTIFKRYEIKYILSHSQKEKIQKYIQYYMREDEFGRSTICNVYYDTEDNILVRRSIEKPVYKEKLRIRSYGIATPDSIVFAELKKKYKSVVYKRRITMKESDAENYMKGKYNHDNSTQILNEIDYFMNMYQGITPKIFLSYEREAFYGKNDNDFRITFDENILWRDYDLSLCDGIYGNFILPENSILMEVKTSGAIPVWLAHFLSENKIFKTSFSKYGNAYKQKIKLLKGA